jgi:hypothetical protein
MPQVLAAGTHNGRLPGSTQLEGRTRRSTPSILREASGMDREGLMPRPEHHLRDYIPNHGHQVASTEASAQALHCALSRQGGPRLDAGHVNGLTPGTINTLVKVSLA